MNLDKETNQVSGSLLNHRFRFLGQKWRFLKPSIESEGTIDPEKNPSSRFRDKKIKQEVEKAEAIAAENMLLPDISIIKPKNPTKRRVSFADQESGGNLLNCLPGEVEPESEERPFEDLTSSNLSKLTQVSGLQENSMDCDFDTIELQISLKHIKAMYKDGQTNGIDRVTTSSAAVTDSPRANYSYCSGSETASQKSEGTPRPPSAPNSSKRKSSKNGRSFAPLSQEAKLNKKLNALQSQVADSFIAKSWKKFAIEKGIRVPECVKNVNIEGDAPETR